MNLPSYIQQLLGSRPVQNRRALGNPRRDWHLVLIISGAVFVVWAGIAAALFFLESEEELGSTPPAGVPAIHSASLEAILARYRALSEEHAAILAAPALLADPSLPKS